MILPVVKPSKSAKKPGKGRAGKLSLSQKLAKLAIADTWLEDSDGTKYYVNAAVSNGKVYVRFRVDIPDSDPLTILLPAKLANQLGLALQRAAFAASVLKPEEVRELWQQLRGKGKTTKAAKTGEVDNEEEDASTEETGTEEEELPDISFA